MSTKNNSLLADMRKALAMAHNTNNAKAITKDFAAGCGVSERTFEMWCGWIDNLHHRAQPWVKGFNKSDVTSEELQVIYKAMLPSLQAITSVDEKLFIRDEDLVAICGYAQKHGKSANGSVDVATGKKAFRREIETMLGNRLAQNDVLTDEEYDIITKYENAEKGKRKAEDKLEGYTDKHGEEVEGLKTKLEKAKKTLGDMKALVKVSKGTKDEELVVKYPVLAGYVHNVKELETEIKDTEKKIDTYAEVIKNNGAKYKELMARIAKIK